MAEIEIGPKLVGEKVCNPARPDWGVGTVLRVQSTTVAGQPQHRVSVQFATGHRTLIVPPARLAAPTAGPQRDSGWLAEAAGTTLDDRLRQLPESVAQFLGTPGQRIVAMAPLYGYTEDPPSLIKWARAQAQVADPLSHWSRDELLAAFGEFCRQRDGVLRQIAAVLRRAEGASGADEVLATVEEPLRGRMRQVLDNR
jgi:hypothetical protein